MLRPYLMMRGAADRTGKEEAGSGGEEAPHHAPLPAQLVQQRRN
jgi:hypothetical protein